MEMKYKGPCNALAIFSSNINHGIFVLYLRKTIKRDNNSSEAELEMNQLTTKPKFILYFYGCLRKCVARSFSEIIWEGFELTDEIYFSRQSA